jgi:hypothetical protein
VRAAARERQDRGDADDEHGDDATEHVVQGTSSVLGTVTVR